MSKNKITALLLILLGAFSLSANVPQWWSDRQVVPAGDSFTPEAIADNYQPALLGQLKFMALQAFETMEDAVPGSAGPALSATVQGFFTFTEDPEGNYAPVLLGQLKAMALPFYQRFNDENYDVNGANGYILTLIENFAGGALPPIPTVQRELLLARDQTNSLLHIRFFDGAMESVFSIALSDGSVAEILSFLNDASIAWDASAVNHPQKNGLVGLAIAATGFPADIIAYTSPDYPYPWPDPATASMEDNYVLANLGQLKYLFSFDLEAWSPGFAVAVNSPALQEGQRSVNTTLTTLSGTVDGFGWNDLSMAIGNAAPNEIPLGEPTSVPVPVAGIAPVDVYLQSEFSMQYLLPKEGPNSIDLHTLDSRDNQTTTRLLINRFAEPPVLTIDQPEETLFTNADSIVISGTTNANSLTLTITQADTSITSPVTLAKGAFFVNQDISGLQKGAVEVALSGTSNFTSTIAQSAERTRTFTIDRTAPALSISSPADNTRTNQTTLSVAGTATDADAVTINGKQVLLNDADEFTASVALFEGSNAINFTATDRAGNRTSESRAVVLDTVPPAVNFGSDAQLIVVPKGTRVYNFTGTVGSALTTVTVNGKSAVISATPNEKGLYTYTYDYALAGGTENVTIVATDDVGNVITRQFTIAEDTTIPSINFLNPAQSAVLTTPYIDIVAQIDDPSATAEFLGAPIAVDANGVIRIENVLLANGENSLEFTLVDPAGNQATETLVLTLELPENVAPQVVSVALDDAENSVLLTFSEPINTTTALGIALATESNPGTPLGYSLRDITAEGAVGTTLSLDARLPEAAPVYPENSVLVLTVPATLEDLLGEPIAGGRTFRLVTRDTLSPLPPIVDALPAYTNQSRITLTGTAEPGADIYDETTKVTTAGSAGRFSFEWALPTLNGTNTLQLIARDASGNVSESVDISIVQNETPMDIDGASFAFGTVDAETGEFTVLSSGLTDVNPSAQAIRITFPGADSADALNLESIQSATILDASLSALPNSITIENNVLTLAFTDTALLAPSQSYEVLLPATLSDLAGNTIASEDVRTSFSTAEAPLDVPIILGVSPQSPFNTDFVNFNLFALPGNYLKVSVVNNGNADISFSPQVGSTGKINLELDWTAYRNSESVITFTAQDTTDDSPNRISPTTEPLVMVHDNVPPNLLSTSVDAVGDELANIAIDASIAITFSEPIDTTALTSATKPIRLLDADNFIVEGAFVLPPGRDTQSGYTLAFQPLRSLQPDADYTLAIDNSVADLAGNRLPGSSSIAFRSGSVPEDDRLSAPVFDSLPTDTIEESVVTLTGEAFPGATLHIVGGREEVTTVVGTSGAFAIQVPLQLEQVNFLIGFVTIEDANGAISAVGASSTVIVRQTEDTAAVTFLSPRPGLIYANRSVTAFGKFDNIGAYEESIQVTNNEGADLEAASFGNYFARQVIFEYPVTLSNSLADLAALNQVTGTNELFIAKLTTNGSLHFKFFDDTGAATLYSQPDLTTPDQIEAIAELDTLLTGIAWDASNQNSATVDRILRDAQNITGHTIDFVTGPAGVNSITVTATPLDGSAPETATVEFDLIKEPTNADTYAPVVTILYPEPGERIAESIVEAMILVEEGSELSYVELNNVTAHRVIGNIFFIYVLLEEQGDNVLTATATDASGFTGADSVTVFFDNIPPPAPTDLNVSELGDAASTPIVSGSYVRDRVTTVSGSAAAGSIIVVENGLALVRYVVPGDEGDGPVTFSISVPLNPNATNELRIYATDASGNGSDVFTHVVKHDDEPPVVVDSIPTHEQVGVQQDTDIIITFSEPIAPASLYSDSEGVFVPQIQVISQLETTIDSSATVGGNLIVSADQRTVTFVPENKFQRADSIRVNILPGITDLSGLPLPEPQFLTFNTALYRTTLTGVVVDEQLDPLPNMRVGILGTDIFQYTTSFGTFILDEVPLGEQIFYVDGRPDPATGVPPQGDNRIFSYLEFAIPVIENTDNGLGRPIFMVPVDYSSGNTISASTSAINFTSDSKDLANLSLSDLSGAVRFLDGSTAGTITATRVEAPYIPDRLPSGAIPHYLVEIGPEDLVFDTPVTITVDDVYELQEKETEAEREVIFFHFKHGMHDYKELGRAVVSPDTGTVTLPNALTESGFIGYVPANPEYDLTRNYLKGRVVDAAGNPIPNVAVNAIAGNTAVFTDALGEYIIPMPEIRLFTISAYASIPTDRGNTEGDSPYIVFESDPVEPRPSGVTRMPDIIVNSFVLFGDIRFLADDGSKIQNTGLAFDNGTLLRTDDSTAPETEIFIYRNRSGDNDNPVFDSIPYAKTTASLDPVAANGFDAGYAITFLGSRNEESQVSNLKSQIPSPGDLVKIVAFNHRTGFYGERDLVIPAIGEGPASSLDIQTDLSLRAPQLEIDLNRVFFIDGVRLRANLGQDGIAFTNDEFIECRTSWRTVDAIPLDREELSMKGRLKVNSIDFSRDYYFSVRGGEQFNILEIRESQFPARLEVLQQETDVGTETFTISPDGSFAERSLVPMKLVNTYGSFETITDEPQQAHRIHIVELDLENGVGGALPGTELQIGDQTITAGASGAFSFEDPGTTGEGGITVGIGDTRTQFGASPTPVINALDETPPGLVPALGSQGDLITINGSNFSPVPENNKVSFNGAPALVVSASESQLEVYVPERASSGPVTVTVSGKQSNPVHFDFISFGINNGSFEDGYFRAYTIKGRGRVVTHLKNLQPTHGLSVTQFMAHLDTEDLPFGSSEIITDKFVITADTPVIAFDFNVMGTNLNRPLHEYLEFYVLVENNDGSMTEIHVPDAFPELESFIYSKMSGYNHGSGFRTAAVPLISQDEIDSGTTQKKLQIRIFLQGRGRLRTYSGLRPDDDNPYDMTKRRGTALLLDNFRLIGSTPAQPEAFDFTDTTAITYSGDTLTLPAGLIPPAAKDIYITQSQTGDAFVRSIPDAGLDLSITLDPITEYNSDGIGYYLLQYRTADDAPEGSEYRNHIYSPTIKFRINAKEPNNIIIEQL